MSCPTCSHTMQGVVVERGIYWCPRCGTLKVEAANAPDDVEAPKLVGYVQQMQATAVRRPQHGFSAVREWPFRAACEAIGRKATAEES